MLRQDDKSIYKLFRSTLRREMHSSTKEMHQRPLCCSHALMCFITCNNISDINSDRLHHFYLNSSKLPLFRSICYKIQWADIISNICTAILRINAFSYSFQTKYSSFTRIENFCLKHTKQQKTTRHTDKCRLKTTV